MILKCLLRHLLHQIFQFFPEANEVQFARSSVFEGASFKLDYLTKPSFFEDFGFAEKVKMTDRVKPEDELFLVAYPYFNVTGSLRFHLKISFHSVNLYIDVNFLFVLRNACGGRAVQGSCGKH